MERAVNQISGNLSGSFSLHSLTEGSEAISEVEEIHEIHSLKLRGDKAFENKNYQEALQCYNDALEIDENNRDALSSRTAVYIKQKKFILAQQDAEKLLTITPHHPQGHYLLGMALHNVGYYKEALLSFLRALDLDNNSDHSVMLADSVASLTKHFCDIPDKMIQKLPEMDSYTKLCEVGGCLYQARKYDLCIRVLSSAQQLQTNQKGITMKIQLMLANAHSILKHKESAVALYQECLTTAISAHDPQYQTKALVNIASLHLESGKTHQAIVYYEKLLNLQRELQDEDPNVPLPDYWSKDLECALELNLSIGYKKIGAMENALLHAHKYVKLIQQNEGKHHLEAQSHHNIGMLYEILGKDMEAAEHYEEYLKKSKQEGDLKGVGLAYGCLGSVYASMQNHQLAVTYHQQHIAIVKKLNTPKLLCLAYEQMGDTYMKLERWHEAIKCFSVMFQVCPKNDLQTQTLALSKMGLAYKSLDRFQYSLYYYEQAKIIAEDFSFQDLKVMCEFNEACILQYSTQMYEFDQARSYFENLIPIFEAKIKQHEDEDTFCPKELHDKLQQCYDGIQMLLAKTGKKGDCLVYAESHRRMAALKLHHSATSRQITTAARSSNLGIQHAWSMEKISSVVSQSGATVVYFSVLEEMFLIWVLQPGEEVVRFHQSRVPDLETNVSDWLKEYITEFQRGADHKALMYNCENRALPLRGTALDLIKKKNKKLSDSDYSEEIDRSFTTTSESMQTNSYSYASTCKPPERKLFNLLFAGIDDVLSKLPEGSPLVIVPDKALNHCPFSIIKDWNGNLLSQRFRVTTIPNLFLLEQVSVNELNRLKMEDELKFARYQSSLGGLPKVLVSSNPFKSHRERHLTNEQWDSSSVDTRKTSNPRLARSGILRPVEESRKSLLSRDSTFVSQTARTVSSFKCQSKKSTVVQPPQSVSLKEVQPVGAPASLERALHAHNLTTLTTKTSTNTDITSTSYGFTEFKQISDTEKCVVFGNPYLPEELRLYDEVWKPPSQELEKAQAECIKVSELLDVTAVMGKKATKSSFLEQIRAASILHVACIGCNAEGVLVMSPNTDQLVESPPCQLSYLVTADDIASCKLVAKLVVISSGWTTYNRKVLPNTSKIASAFLIAGSQCVLTLLWPIPQATLDKFYFYFYSSLYSGQQVTLAAAEAMDQLRKDNRYSSLCYWSPFLLTGKDVYVSVSKVRHAMLDQSLDEAEKNVIQETQNDPLNPPVATPQGVSREENLKTLQQCLAKLLALHIQHPNVILLLLDLLDGALKRLHVEDNIRSTSHLADELTKSESSLQLLKMLGFHFQAIGADLSYPYVVYPHWNVDELLVPTYDALRAIMELACSKACTRALYELFPTSQENISYIVDVLCISRHAPDIQLKVSDLTVKLLWNNVKVKALMVSLGFHQIGPLLTFDDVPSHRKLLTASLQLLISVSIHKSPALIHKLDVSLLGGPGSPSKSSLTSWEGIKLPSLTPLILPRNQLQMSTPWLSTIERPEEMKEKLRLARSKSDLESEYRQNFSRAKTWHEQTLSAQADENLEKVGRPCTTPRKVKVKPGATASQDRVPVSAEKPLSIPEINQRRDYAHYILAQRLDKVVIRHKQGVHKAYMPYVNN